ncbi:MAG: hypothetical protein E6J14_08950 [Chloroflexi bacterium]|nr:MAG: hypothetical protein E6J14_08950 [Chloroflexota bacterium]
MNRHLLAIGAAVLAAGATIPAIPLATRASYNDQAGHDAAVQKLRDRGYLVGDEARYAALKEAAIAKAPGWQGVAAARPSRPPASTAAPAPSPSFGGVRENDLSPSDSTGAIGTTEYVEAINVQLALYSRSGSKIASGPAEKLTGTTHFDLSDPQVLWDKNTNRFYYLYLDVTDSTFRWGFSKSAGPKSVTGRDWCSYTADFGYGLELPDYPKMGQTTHNLIVSANVYAGQAFVGADLDFIQKPSGTATITSCPKGPFAQSQTRMLTNPDGAPASDLSPGVQEDAGLNAWVAGLPDPTNSGTFTGSYLDLYEVTETGPGTATVSPATAITVASYDLPAPAPQKGTTAALDTLDGRLTHAVTDRDPAIGGLALWTSHTVFGGAGAQVRWYEINVTSQTLAQPEGYITDPSLSVLDGGVSDDRAVNAGLFGSDMVAGVTTSSSTTYPADQEVVKVGHAGAQSPLAMVHQSPAADQGFDCFVDPGRFVCRWGDYSGAVPDPAPPSATVGRVWLAQMDSVGGGPNPLAAEWGTWNWAAAP